MTSEGLFTLLAFAQCGAFALTVDQTVVFWNSAAERLLGFAPHDVIGRKCYEISASNGENGLTELCCTGCPSMRYLRAGLVPVPTKVRMLCQDGRRKWVSVSPMVATAGFEGSLLLVNFFEELEQDPGELFLRSEEPVLALNGGDGVLESEEEIAEAEGVETNLTRREIEVLQRVAAGVGNVDIAKELEISLYTVRNHIRNLRQKLGAASKLEAVLVAARLGIVSFE